MVCCVGTIGKGRDYGLLQEPEDKAREGVPDTAKRREGHTGDGAVYAVYYHYGRTAQGE